MDSRWLIRSSCRAGNTVRLVCTAHSLTASSMAVREVTVGGNAEPIGIAEARSALAWWLEAGVDVAVQEEPRDWLRPAPARPSPLADPIPAPNLTEPSPETLAELRDWLSSSAQLPLASATPRRILP